MLKSLRQSMRKVTRPLLTRKYESLQRVLEEWDRIAGPEFARACTPVRFSYQKPKDAKAKPNAILEVSTTSAFATTLHYQKGVMLERLNHIFGSQWITDIRFIHNNSIAPGPGTAQPPARPLSENDRTSLAAGLGAITDDDLKARLERFGKSLFQKGKSG